MKPAAATGNPIDLPFETNKSQIMKATIILSLLSLVVFAGILASFDTAPVSGKKIYNGAVSQPTDVRKICRNSSVPPGFVVIDHGTDFSSCNYNAQYNRVNIRWIGRISGLPVGAVAKVCHYQKTPANWVDVDYQRDPSCCAEPSDIIPDNVKFIQRVN
jgi:hypothetical protein